MLGRWGGVLDFWRVIDLVSMVKEVETWLLVLDMQITNTDEFGVNGARAGTMNSPQHVIAKTLFLAPEQGQ